MLKFFASYIAFEILIVVVAVAGTVWVSYRRRHAKSWQPQPGFQRTDEVFTDPTTGIVKRVWYNPATGERQYETLKR